MSSSIRQVTRRAICAFIIGFCFVAGAYVAHDLWRTVDDESVLWLVNRLGAGYAIAMFVVFGIITARVIEVVALDWWRGRRQKP